MPDEPLTDRDPTVSRDSDPAPFDPAEAAARDDGRPVASVHRWANGMVMVFGPDGQQIPELQGRATPERLRGIRVRSTHETRWLGFDEDGPLDWNTLRPVAWPGGRGRTRPRGAI